MYWRWVACLFAGLAGLSLFGASAAACESAPEQTSYVTTTEYVKPPSWDWGETKYDLEPQTVVRPVTTEPASSDDSSPNPGGVGISASFFL